MKAIDSSAFVASVLGEKGWEIAKADIDTGIMSLVNVAESIAVLMRKGFSYFDAVDAMETSELKFHIPTLNDAYEAAKIVQTPGLSLGDSFCLALAKSLSTSAVTADRMWAEHNLGVAVELIR
jgi:ribonuclease VapC